ncbi:unnamed protein product [Musa textilis]
MTDVPMRSKESAISVSLCDWHISYWNEIQRWCYLGCRYWRLVFDIHNCCHKVSFLQFKVSLIFDKWTDIIAYEFRIFFVSLLTKSKLLNQLSWIFSKNFKFNSSNHL